MSRSSSRLPRWVILFAAISLQIFASAQAATLPLESRLGGLAYYDPNLDITWATDANLHGFGSNWDIQTDWVATLTIGSVSGWRLPSADVNGDDTIDFCIGGAGGCEDNEMAFLYWKEGITSAAPGPFTNVLATTWWSETEFALADSSAWFTSFNDGSTSANSKTNFRFAWAVHDGDVGVVPVPAAVWLFGSALGLLGWLKRKAG